MPGRRRALGHPHLLLGRVPGVTVDTRVALILVGSVLVAAAMVWSMMGRTTGSFFFIKGIFWALLVLLK